MLRTDEEDEMSEAEFDRAEEVATAVIEFVRQNTDKDEEGDVLKALSILSYAHSKLLVAAAQAVEGTLGGNAWQVVATAIAGFQDGTLELLENSEGTDR